MNKLTILFTCVFLFSLTAMAKNINKDIGVLVLAHGGNTTWNENVKDAVAPLKNEYTVEIAFGMANPFIMQKAIDKLEAQDVKSIVVVQLFVSSYSMIIRQNEYLLGFRNQLVDPPMIMMHGQGHHGHGMNQNSGTMEHNNHHHNMNDNAKKEAPTSLKQLEINTPILLTKPLNDDDIVTSILIDRINDLSDNAMNETLILVAHGPNDNMDNKMWLTALHELSIQVKSAFGTNTFRNIEYLTLRDDALKEVYNKAKLEFRNLVKEANIEEGKALIVPVLLSNGGVEKRLQKRLDGLEYVYNNKTLLPDRKITKFIQNRVAMAIKNYKQASK